MCYGALVHIGKLPLLIPVLSLCLVQVALAVGDNELRPTLPSDTPEPLLNIALACYDPEPENRPSFALIVHHMRKVSSSSAIQLH